MDWSAIARRLPAEFIAAPGMPAQRLSLLVHRYWSSRSEAELRQLADALRPLLEPLLKSPRSPVSAEVQNRCERLVREWNERLESTP